MRSPFSCHGVNQPVTPVTPIRTWPDTDRPRERLLRLGPAALSDAELLALVVGSGATTREGGVSALGVARDLLVRHGSLRRLGRRSTHEWMDVVGIGAARAARVGAAFEIGRRVAAEPVGPRPRVRGPSDIAAVYAPALRDLDREVFHVALLNTAGEIVADHRTSAGGLASSIVEPRAVFRVAVLESAAAVVCVHNHPSGNPEPSAEDIAVTRQLVEAGRVLGIPLRDHVIIAGDGWTSLAERGAL